VSYTCFQASFRGGGRGGVEKLVLNSDPHSCLCKCFTDNSKQIYMKLGLNVTLLELECLQNDILKMFAVTVNVQSTV